MPRPAGARPFAGCGQESRWDDAAIPGVRRGWQRFCGKGNEAMELIDNLFVAENVANLETVIYSLRRDIPVLRLYCIVYFADRNRLEILSSRELFTPRYKGRKGVIAGIAMGRAEAVDMLLCMAREAAEKGRNAGDPSQLIL